MKRRTSSATFILFLTMAANALAAPAIVVEQPVFNFGAVSEGAKVTHVFTIKNSGDTPLTILHVRPSCGCTAANVSSPTIQPGKTGEIKATFDTANFSGSMTKTIAVETNDPTKPTATLTMKGTVSADIQVIPKQLNFGQVKAGTSHTLPLIVENKGSKPFRITAVKSPMPQVVVKNEKQLIKQGDSARIEVSVTPRSEDRILSGYLTISTDHPAKAEILVPVYGSPTR